MPLLGLILLAAAVVVAVELVLANKAPMTVHLWKWDWNIHTYGLAIWGAAILLVALLGWWMIWRGTARRIRRRRERRALAAENEELAQRVEAADATDGDIDRDTDERLGRTHTEPPQPYRSPYAGDQPTRVHPAPAPETAAARQTPAEDATRAYPTPAGGPYPDAPGAPNNYPGHPQLTDEATTAYRNPENPPR